MRNRELKCRCADLEALRQRALALGAREAQEMRQRDRFFPGVSGRLKLRTAGDGAGELIAYRRPDRAGARTSEYAVYRTRDPETLAATLALALGTAGEVVKRRRVLLLRHTRIHLDEVDGLGDFVELETVLEGIDEEEGAAELAEIAEGLGLSPEEGIPGAYVDQPSAIARPAPPGQARRRNIDGGEGE